MSVPKNKTLAKSKRTHGEYLDPDPQYTPELGQRVCGLIAEGYTLKHITAQPGMPKAARILTWARDIEEFGKELEKARLLRVALRVDEIFDIADDSTNDWVEREIVNRRGEVVDKVMVLNIEHVKRSSMRIDIRKWEASKLLRQVYGDRLDLTSDGKPLPTGGPTYIIQREEVAQLEAKLEEEV